MRALLVALNIAIAIAFTASLRADDDVRTWLAGRTLAEGAIARARPQAVPPAPVPTAAEPSEPDPFAGEELTRFPDAVSELPEEEKNSRAVQRSEDAQYVISLLVDTQQQQPLEPGEMIPEAPKNVPDAWRRIIATGRNERERAMLALLLVGAARLEEHYGIPQAATITMALHESGYGLSRLTTDSHNWFGLKARTGENSVEMPTRELGRTVRARFRSFDDALQGLDGFGRFLSRPLYRAAYQFRHEPRAFIAALLRAGYCPEPDYLVCIDTIAERHNLWSLEPARLALAHPR